MSITCSFSAYIIYRPGLRAARVTPAQTTGVSSPPNPGYEGSLRTAFVLTVLWMNARVAPTTGSPLDAYRTYMLA